MSLHVEYLFAFVLSLSAKTTKGREYGVFFHIKENHFFNFDSESLFRSEKTDFLLSCFLFVCEPRFLQERKLSGEPRISYLRGGEMETNSAADRLLQPNGSLHLRKVFCINNMSRFSDNNSR